MSPADQRRIESAKRTYAIEAIRILPPEHVELTAQQRISAVVVLSELLMPLLRARLLTDEDSSPEAAERP